MGRTVHGRPQRVDRGSEWWRRKLNQETWNVSFPDLVYTYSYIIPTSYDEFRRRENQQGRKESVVCGADNKEVKRRVRINIQVRQTRNDFS